MENECTSQEDYCVILPEYKLSHLDKRRRYPCQLHLTYTNLGFHLEKSHVNVFLTYPPFCRFIMSIEINLCDCITFHEVRAITHSFSDVTDFISRRKLFQTVLMYVYY